MKSTIHAKHFSLILNAQTLPNSSRSIRATKSLRDKQNLKAIARYIKILLSNNHQLSIKHIAYILYELISNTNFSIELLRKGLLLDANTFRTLQSKYSEKIYQTHIIRNVRRRLYDVLNVLISAQIIDKYNKVIFLNQNKSSIEYQGSDQTQLNGKETRKALSEQVKNKKSTLAGKYIQLEMLTKKYLLLKKMHKFNIASNHSISERIMFPFILIEPFPQSKIQLQTNLFEVRSNSQITIMTEMNFVEKLHKVEQSESQHFMNYLQRNTNAMQD